MVSARAAGIGPIYAISSTAAAAPVTNFTPRIPSNPFMTLTDSSALEPACRLLPSQYPAAPYSPHKRDGTPPRPKAVETLHVQHPGHTSDSERDFNSASVQEAARRRTPAAAPARAKPAPR